VVGQQYSHNLFLRCWQILLAIFQPCSTLLSLPVNKARLTITNDKMTTKSDKPSHASLHFKGQYRPLHSEADTVDQAVSELLGKVKCDEIAKTLRDLLADFNRSRKAGIGISSASSQHGYTCVTISDYPRDRWLDELTDQMPCNPLLSY
jgi:hypothetical protein